MIPGYTDRQAVVGATVGLIVGLALEVSSQVLFSSMSGTPLVPKSWDWILIPFTCAFVGWRFSEIDRQHRTLKYWALCCVLWIVCVNAFFTVFNPYDHDWSPDEFLQVLLVAFVPPAVAWFGKILFLWASK